MAVLNELKRDTKEGAFYALSLAIRWRDAAGQEDASSNFNEADDFVQKLKAEYRAFA